MYKEIALSNNNLLRKSTLENSQLGGYDGIPKTSLDNDLNEGGQNKE